jgi:hypothetical protein
MALARKNMICMGAFLVIASIPLFIGWGLTGFADKMRLRLGLLLGVCGVLIVFAGGVTQ